MLFHTGQQREDLHVDVTNEHIDSEQKRADLTGEMSPVKTPGLESAGGMPGRAYPQERQRERSEQAPRSDRART